MNPGDIVIERWKWDRIEAALRHAQRVIGSETSIEAQQPRSSHAVYVAPISMGDKLRLQATDADRRDKAIVEVRDALQLMRQEEER